MSLAALARSVQIQVLGSVLLHFLWQGLLIAGLLWLLLAALVAAVLAPGNGAAPSRDREVP